MSTNIVPLLLRDTVQNITCETAFIQFSKTRSFKKVITVRTFHQVEKDPLPRRILYKIPVAGKAINYAGISLRTKLVGHYHYHYHYCYCYYCCCCCCYCYYYYCYCYLSCCQTRAAPSTRVLSVFVSR